MKAFLLFYGAGSAVLILGFVWLAREQVKDFRAIQENPVVVEREHEGCKVYHDRMLGVYWTVCGGQAQSTCWKQTQGKTVVEKCVSHSERVELEVRK